MAFYHAVDPTNNKRRMFASRRAYEKYVARFVKRGWDAALTPVETQPSGFDPACYGRGVTRDLKKH